MMNEQPQPERQVTCALAAEQPQAAPDTTESGSYEDEDEDEALPPPLAPRERSVACLLATAAFEDAAGPALMRRLRTAGDGVCVCVGVPDTSWEGPLREMAAEIGRPVRVSFRDANARPSNDHETSFSNIRWLQGGAAVLCVSQDVRTGVRSEFLSVADAVVTVQVPTPDMIAGAIAAVGGGWRRRRMPPDLGQGLSLLEISACLRMGEANRRTVARLKRAQRGKRSSAIDAGGPRLEEMAGYGEAAEWGMSLREPLAEYLAGRIAWKQLDAQILLYGPPGTGKSWFAPALAHTLGVRCIRTSVGSWFASHAGDLGQTVKAVAAIFAEARAEARTRGAVVLFIDEIDGLPNRVALDAREGSWWRPVVNYVLATLDGGAELDGLVLVAATNDLAAVDTALLRPGRFGRHHHVGPPGLDDLVSIMVHHLGGPHCPLSRDALAGVLRARVGATQARAASWAREALRRARTEGREVGLGDVAAVVLPADARPDRDRRRVATHEAGHAVAATLLGGTRLVSTSIVPTDSSNGGTALLHRDEALLTRDEIEAGIVMLLAGRAAETVVLKEATAAAGGIGDLAATSDLAQATSRLTAVHASYGLGQALRYRGDGLRSAAVREDREVGQLVETDLRRLMVRAERFLAGKVDAVRAVADALLERGFLDAAEVARIVAAAGAGGGSPN